MTVLNYFQNRQLHSLNAKPDTSFLFAHLKAETGCDLQRHSNDVYPMSLDAKCCYLAVASSKGSLYVIKRYKTEDPEVLTDFGSCVLNAQFLDESQILATTADGKLYLMDIISLSVALNQYVVEALHFEFISHFSFLNQNSVATITNLGDARVWDLRSSAHHVLSIPRTKSDDEMVCRANGVYVNHRYPDPVSNFFYAYTSQCYTERSIGQRVIMAVANTPFVFTAGSCVRSICQWDIRYLKYATEKLIPSDPASKKGFGSLAFDSWHNIYASCTDGNIYKYESKASFCGWRQSETFKTNGFGLQTGFYVPIQINDNYLTSGSRGNRGYIWSIDRGQAASTGEHKAYRSPAAVLHTSAPCFGLFADPSTMEFYSCTDAMVVDCWSLNRELKD